MPQPIYGKLTQKKIKPGEPQQPPNWKIYSQENLVRIRNYVMRRFPRVGIENAEEIAHAALIRVAEKNPQMTRANIRSYMMRAAINDAMYAGKSNKRHEKILAKVRKERKERERKKPREPQPHEAMAFADTWEKIIRQLRQRHEEHAVRAFIMRHRDQMSYHEIAGKLGMSQGTVASTLNRQINTLIQEGSRRTWEIVENELRKKHGKRAVKAFLLRYRDGKSYDEIAIALGTRKENIARMLNKSLETLKALKKF